MHFFLDYDEDRLYFLDFNTGEIKFVNTNGSNLTNIFNISSRGTNYDLAVNGDYIYCINYNETIKVQKHPGGNSKIVHTATGHIYSVFVYDENGNYCSYLID